MPRASQKTKTEFECLKRDSLTNVHLQQTYSFCRFLRFVRLRAERESSPDLGLLLNISANLHT